MDNIADLRREYSERGLAEHELAGDPFAQFRLWFDEAVAREMHEPNAMTLATASADGTPSARIVLLKGFDDRGFTFFTNYESRKGQELADNPRASLVFAWLPMERQIRIDGVVARVTRDESQAYYDSRPHKSRISAWVSEQSQVVANREELEQQWEAVKAKYGEGPVPLPPHWGGYRLAPVSVEFWQGRQSRLHDRLRFQRDSLDSQAWTVQRLAP